MKLKVLAFAALCAIGCSAPRELHDVVYDARHGAAGTLDLYLPDLDGRAHALVYFIHGGAWKAGDKTDFTADARRLASSGFAVASTNYRLLPDGVFPGNAQDCNCAYAYLRAHAEDYDIDPARVVVMGYSAGGQLAGLVSLENTEPELVSDCAEQGGRMQPPPLGVVSVSGPEDMVKLYGELGAASTIDELIGGTPDDRPDAYALASPVEHVVPGGPPWLVIEDGFDWGGIVEMAQTLKEAGVPETLLQVVGSLHVFEQWDEPGEYEVGVPNDAPEAWIAIEGFLFDTVGTP